MTNNETILDLIMRDMVCADTLEHLEAQRKALDDRILATVKERNAIAEKIVPMIWPSLMPTDEDDFSFRSFLLPSGKVATVTNNGDICAQDVTKL